MQLFISYSRDDKAWVYELWRALRDEGGHDAWIDQRLVPAVDWWGTILDNIESRQCFIYVMTPASVGSIYCRAELDYAIACNIPILPVMLKPCSVPAALDKKRVQYQAITDDMNMDRVLLKINSGLHAVEIATLQGKYPRQSAPRPDVPKPQKKPEQVSEAFLLAAEAAAAGDFALAEDFFQQVIDADPGGLGLAAAERLADIQLERSRAQDYGVIVRLAANTVLIRDAQAAARVFVQKYGGDHDPSRVIENLLRPRFPPPQSPRPVTSARKQPALLIPQSKQPEERLSEEEVLRLFESDDDVQEQPPSPHRIRPSSLDILPKPFAWIDIPAGKVTLTEGGYVNKGGQSFDVPAFSIAKYPVTNAQFAKFVEADGYNQRQWWTDEGWKLRERYQWIKPRYWQDSKWNRPDYPVVGVSWFEAIAFCLWLSDLTGEKILLPTEQQWQRAAQGNTDWAYPWGNGFDHSRCNFNSDGTTSVTQYEDKGTSPFGTVDMSGNVWEWCLTNFEDGAQDINALANNRRVVRGDSWYGDRLVDLQVDCRNYLSPDSYKTNGGFRLARSSPSIMPKRIPSRVSAPAHSRRNSAQGILPKPFAWIDIPAGKVTLTEGGYVPEGGQSFDVPAFSIAKYPLTNAQFRKFWDAKGYDHKEWWTDEGWEFKERENWTEPRYWQDSQWNKDDYPVVGVSWFEAVAFCLWLSDITGENISLPTEQQWQRAAQGDTNRAYPWGDTFDNNRCNFNAQGTMPVTHYESNSDSPFKVVDMSGNVWEWCVTDYENGSQHVFNKANKRVLRGGSWNYNNEASLRADYRNWVAPVVRYDFGGVRLARS